MYKVSVVVPIYNVSDTIERCAESLFNQTLEDLQFIFVDDGSPDDSVTRLEQTLKRYPQREAHTIILHHSKNKSLPQARATGLACVEAPYVAHCDSDDFVEPNMYQKFYETAVIKQADMVVCGYFTHHSDGTVKQNCPSPASGIEPLIALLHGHADHAVWCRLTRADIYRKVNFSTDNCFEDGLQVAQLLAYSSNVVYVKEVLYHYVENPKSITQDQQLEVMEERVRQCKANYDKVHGFVMKEGLAKEDDFYGLKCIVRNCYFPLLLKGRCRKAYLQTFPELNKEIFTNSRYGWISRIEHLCILLGVFHIVFPIARFLYRRC